MTLTVEERKVAAERARSYPKGCGFSYVGRQLTKEDAIAGGVSANYIADDPPLSTPLAAIIWLTDHPEDLALGCPAVAVAQHRDALCSTGMLKSYHDIVDAAFPEEDNAMIAFCSLLDTDPVAVAARLYAEVAAATNDAKEAKDGTDG